MQTKSPACKHLSLGIRTRRPTTPVDVKLGLVRPFTYGSPSDYRPDGPLELGSRRYARDVAEVQAVGRVDSTTRIYQLLDELLTDVENAPVWGGLHFRTTMTQSAKHFSQIARDIGRRHFLVNSGDHHHDDDRDDRE